MDIEVKVTWDGIGPHGADPEPQWVPTAMYEKVDDYPYREAIFLLLETNDTVTLRDDSIGCTLIYRKKEE